jgi:hypothetical protein
MMKAGNRNTEALFIGFFAYFLKKSTNAPIYFPKNWCIFQVEHPTGPQARSNSELRCWALNVGCSMFAFLRWVAAIDG